jgi:hypothetical protein
MTHRTVLECHSRQTPIVRVIAPLIACGTESNRVMALLAVSGANLGLFDSVPIFIAQKP